MKRIAMTVAFVLVAGCSTKPLAVVSPTALPLDAAFACAFRLVNELNYVVTRVDKGAGYIYAEKQSRAHSAGPVVGNKYADYLTVSIYDTDSAGHKIRVIAASDMEVRQPFGVQRSARKPTPQVKADADSLLKACEKAPQMAPSKGS